MIIFPSTCLTFTFYAIELFIVFQENVCENPLSFPFSSLMPIS